ncbi:MAG: hypothetical protein IJR61_07580 [Clostridia bacterium]|nr:hypothetical protein [Clostridia bacterium]
MENGIKFYPSVEYNRKRRLKYFVLFAVMVTIFALMDVWFVTTKFYMGLFLNAFIILFIVLTPKTLKETPVGNKPAAEIFQDKVVVMGKTVERKAITSVAAIVYLGKVGNLVENRQFLEKCAAEAPLENMMGSFEITYEKDGKKTTEYAVIENITEALMIFVKEGKADYRLGYSLGKEYRRSVYNLKEYAAEQATAAETKVKSKTKQLI